MSALPAWLKQEYIQTKLRVFHKDPGLNVIKLCSQVATGRGENFAGINSRINVEFQISDGSVEQRSYLLKETLPVDIPQSKVFLEYNVYTREMDMYEFILPQLTQLLREVGITDKLHADAISVDRDHSIIILEDLTPLNYKNANRVEKLDLEHTHLALEMLGRFHAAAFMLGKLQPQLLSKISQNFEQGVFTRGAKGYRNIFTGFFKILIRFVRSQPKLKVRYYEKMEILTDNLMEYGARSFDVTDDDFQTLAHGDCWTTNIMFHYDSKGQPTTVLPIDFQLSTQTSPVTDLHFFFNTSLQEGVYERESELVQYYYYALKCSLEQLQYKGKLLSLQEFQVQFEKRRFAALPAMAFQPMMTYEGTNFTGFSDFYEDNEEAIRFQDSLYSRQTMQLLVEKRLAEFYAKGLLDAHLM